MDIHSIKPNQFPEDVLLLLSANTFLDVKGFLHLRDRMCKYTAKRLNNNKVQIIIEDKLNGD